MSTLASAARTMPIEAIQIVDRHRRDLGSLDGLRESIAERGLLHPVVVTPAGRLVAGERRLAACAQLGWTEVPVTIANSLDSVSALLAAERDENTCRLDMAPSEKVALGRALEALKGIGGRGQGARTDLTSGNFTEVQKGETRELVGSAVGFSGPTYERARKVVQEAEAGNPVAVEALEQMDATGKVTPAYEKVVGRSISGRDISAPKPVTRDGTRKRPPVELVENVVGMVENLPGVLQQIDVQSAVASTHAPLADWDKRLTGAIRALVQLRKQIKGANS